MTDQPSSSNPPPDSVPTGDDGLDSSPASNSTADEELDAAYRAVLERMDAVEWELQSALAEASESMMDVISDDEDDGEGSEAPTATPAPNDEVADRRVDDELPHRDHATPTSDEHLGLEELAAQLLDEPVERHSLHPSNDHSQIAPRQVIEAALFVGAKPLTSKQLCSLLRREFDQGYVERRIEELNDLYASQGRPYQIELGEGGYRIELKSEFDSVRNRVFGLGPKEVKLSQDALEVLSFVAYRQPVTKKQLEDNGKNNAGSTLRQLLRRDLIALKRDTDRKAVEYVTTNRFLELFGVGSIDELPVADDLDFK
jgi:segregation and condensation protein B